MPTTPLDIEHEFRAILAPDSLRAATAADAVCGVQPRLVLEPPDEQQLAAVLRLANDAGLAVIPRGSGTKLSWGNPPARADIILSTARLDKIIEHAWADLTVSVEAGCTIQKLQEALAQHGQRLALNPLWPEQATISGILSTNDSGPLRLRFGALRDLIIGVTLALPDGTLASSGGKVVKNVAGYDLPKLVTGALGTLAVITRAVFRLHPLPRNAKTLSISGCTLEDMQRFILRVQDSKLAHTALQARNTQDAESVVDILFEGTEAGIAAQEAQLRELARPAQVLEALSAVWNASQELWNSAIVARAAVAKITALPASISRTVETVERAASSRKTNWKLTMQATGIGWLSLDAAPENLHAVLSDLRFELEHSGGSLVHCHYPPEMSHLDAWGQPGDALPLMRAVKNQFDPKNTLNPGRFLAGI
ncbi:MAG TPA: FAD-binding oxidoreductase [Verrucomicrobiae bacterium]|jgi:glycolate oxidase FAD binding subunit|nr:FAD-binding oxidoreductase [Verrucomicrobiae bacterium]